VTFVRVSRAGTRYGDQTKIEGIVEVVRKYGKNSGAREVPSYPLREITDGMIIGRL